VKGINHAKCLMERYMVQVNGMQYTAIKKHTFLLYVASIRRVEYEA